MSSDGSKLHESWLAALKLAQDRFRSLISGNDVTSDWKRVPVPSSSGDNVAGASALGANGLAAGSAVKGKHRPRVSDVVMHRRTVKGDDVVRVVLEIPAEDGLASLDAWKAVLATPELRKEWDPTVESSSIVETCFDPDTRLSKTDFTLGWPANPRDAITISRTFADATTLIDISTSLPRSPDEPAYLRPAPPFVRSHVHLFAWCIQIIAPPSESSSRSPSTPKIRITCFWQHDLKAIWGTNNLSQNLPAVVVGLVRSVRKRGNRTPTLSGWGNGVGIDNIAFNIGREALRLDYSIFPEDLSNGTKSDNVDLKTFQEKKRLDGAIEVVVPLTQGWDVQISTRASSEDTSKLPWTVHATRITSPNLPPPIPSEASRSSTPSPPGSSPSYEPQYVAFRLVHARPPEHAILKVKVVMELSGGSNGLRVNGSPHPIEDSESRDPSTLPKDLVADGRSISGLSFQSISTVESQASSTTQQTSPLVRSGGNRTPAAEKAILSLVRRNYIYFTSLLQEPEAKWRAVTESRGVTISQLDSIDPTLVVYRAEAVFVGLGIWDLLSIIKTPGSRVYWDRGFDDAVLLEDVNELTELWRHSTKAVWPVNARDTILLSTSYKSPTAVHVFSFSTDDKKLFPGIPDPEPAVIRTQVDLQGWSIEALSPNTTLLTLLDQSDPKGWSNKSSIPQQMVATLAGVGEYAIKCGGPPVATRFGGSKVSSMKYDHEKATFKVEYEGCETRRHSLISANDMLSTTPEESVIDLSLPMSASRPKSISRPPEMPKVECEIRCDLDTWASIIELVVDPPPQVVTCLKRHRLSSGGGGLWITIEHDAMSVADERLMVTVRKGTSTTGREKSGVIVNGLRTKVDVEELPESEVKSLAKQKRVKPVRIPLDQPPVLGVIRRRRAEWEDDADSDAAGSGGSPKGKGASPLVPSPLTKFFVTAMQQTVNTTAAAATIFTPASSMSAALSPTSSSDPSGGPQYPMARALKILEYLLTQRNQSSVEGWTFASEKAGLGVTKKVEPELSPVIPVHRADKVIEGISAGEVAHAITNYGCQKAWDTQLAGWTPLEDYGYGCSTAFVVRHSGFPFRDRGFWTATASAQLTRKAGAPDGNDSALEITSLKSGSSPHSPTILIASTSFSPSASKSQFSAQKVNPLVFPTGNLILSGWILEAIDPYQDDGNHPIPSTRCSHFIAMDYRGNVPVAFNNTMNATLPRSEILALESWLKSKVGLGAAAMTRLPASNLLVDSEVKPAASTAPLEDVEDEPTEDHWQLEPRDSGRMLLSEDFDPQTLAYEVRIALEPGLLSAAADDEVPRPPLIRPQPRRLSSVIPSADYASLRSGRVSPTPGSGTLPSVGSVAAEASMESSASSLTVRGRRQSGSTTPLRQSSLHQRFPSSPQNSLPSTPYRSATLGRSRKFSSASIERMPERSPTDDPVVAEVVINPALFPRGYQITVAAGSPPPSNPWDRSQAFSSLNSTIIPFSAMVYTTPASPLLSMVNDNPAPRHLLCITLPTAQFYAPAILDPLTGENRPPPVKPSWVSDLESRGAIVELRIVGNTDTPASTREASPKTTFNGKEIVVISERKSVVAVGRDYLEDDSVSAMPFLKRISSPASTARAQKTLDEPRTIDASLLEEPKAESQENLVTDPVSPEPPAPLEAEKDEKENPTESTTEARDPSPRPVSQLFSIWNASTSLLGWGQVTMAAPTIVSTPDPSSTQPNGNMLDEPIKPEADSSNAPSEAATSTTAVDTLLPRELALPRLYQLHTIIIVAIIAFLFGSLVRSLASPADFIYFSSTSPDSDDALIGAVDPGAAGWREVRRLFEFKRGLFGWDVVIAVVRRPR